MDDVRLSQSGTSRNHNKYVYKKHQSSYPHLALQYSGPNSFSRFAVVVAIGIMVSAWLIVKVLVAFAPVYAQYGAPSKLPLLLDATGEQLTAGLEAGHFTSVDLVQVSTMSTTEAGR
jgi:hypothetical protein